MLKQLAGTIWKNLTPYLRLKIIRSTQQKFTVSVAAVVINDNNEILLLDHVLRPYSNWGIPGGFVKSNEQPEEAVKRELHEETGIELYDLELFRVRTNSRHIEILYRAKAVGTAQVRSREINAVGWFSIEKLPEDLSEGQKIVAKKVLEDLTKS